MPPSPYSKHILLRTGKAINAINRNLGTPCKHVIETRYYEWHVVLEKWELQA